MKERTTMAVCEVCTNDYDRTFEVHTENAIHIFDSFECAIHRLAPVCAHCGCRILGHGVQRGDVYFCCAHCAGGPATSGAPGATSTLRDRL